MHRGKILLKRIHQNYEAGFCIIQSDLETLNSYTVFLHSKEQAYFDYLKAKKRKASYLLGRIAAKQAISIVADTNQLEQIIIDFGIFQFPVVKGLKYSNWQVSISHCDDIGISVAFPEDHPLGIDIERLDEDKLDAIKTQMVANELQLINDNQLSELVGYTLLWTAKEGLSKILKTGLTINLQTLEIETFKKLENSYCLTFKNFIQYKAIAYVLGEYIFTLVLPKRTEAQLKNIELAIQQIRLTTKKKN